MVVVEGRQRIMDKQKWLRSEKPLAAGKWQIGSSALYETSSPSNFENTARDKRLERKRAEISKAAGLKAKLLEEEAAALDGARSSVVRLVQLRRLLQEVETTNERRQREERGTLWQTFPTRLRQDAGRARSSSPDSSSPEKTYRQQGFRRTRNAVLESPLHGLTYRGQGNRKTRSSSPESPLLERTYRPHGTRRNRSSSPESNMFEQTYRRSPRISPLPKDARGFRRPKSATAAWDRNTMKAATLSHKIKATHDELRNVEKHFLLESFLGACIEGDNIRVKSFLGRHDAMSLVRGVDEHFRTCLHLAARYGHVNVCSTLLMRQADVNAREEHGATPLALASMHGHVSVQKLLTSQRAKPKPQDLIGRNAYHYACWGPCVDAVKFLQNVSSSLVLDVDYEGRNGLYYAIANPHRERFQILELILKSMCDVNHEDCRGRTPLWHAAQVGNVKIAEMLLEFGADPDLLDVRQEIKQPTPFATWPPAKERGKMTGESVNSSTHLEKAKLANRGVLCRSAFEKALRACMVSEEEAAKLSEILSWDIKRWVHRELPHTSFEEEWSKLSHAAEVDAGLVWALATAEAQHSYWKEQGLGGCVSVMETSHPYDSKPDEWLQTVCVRGARSLHIHFASSCATFDDCSSLTIACGGLIPEAAGRGARIKATSGLGNLIKGTVVAASEVSGSLWKVQLDDGKIASISFDMKIGAVTPGVVPCVNQEPDRVEVSYTDGLRVGTEIDAFILDTIASVAHVIFAEDEGPAQQAGVESGWLLDLEATLFGESWETIAALPGSGSVDAPQSLAAALRNAHDLQCRLNQLLQLADVTLVFTSGLRANLLPEAHITYERQPSDEIRQLQVDAGKIRITKFAALGPAHEAGVRLDWHLDVEETLSKCPRLAQITTAQALLSDPKQLLELSGVTLVFKLADTQSREIFKGHGKKEKECWRQVVRVPSDTALFKWVTDGDAASDKDDAKRWGFAALIRSVQDVSTPPLQQAEVDQLISGWSRITAMAEGRL